MSGSILPFRFLLIIALCAIRAFAEDAEYQPSLKGMQGLRIFYDTEAKLRLVRSYERYPGFDFLHISHEFADVFVVAENVEGFKSVLQENEIEYNVFVENVEDVVAQEYEEQQEARRLEAAKQRSSSSKALSFTYYPDYNEIVSHLEDVARRNPGVVTLLDLGATYEGRRLKGVKLSSGGAKKPAIFIDAGIHAREWIAPATALFILEELLKNRNLLKSVDWYIVPVLNPDGYQYTHSSSANRLWRKTRSKTSVSSCRGTDANRNFELGWMAAGASNNPCSDTYAGPKPFSEPESQALKNFLLARKGTIKVYLTLHSYGQYLLYPWGYTTALPPNEATLRSVAVKAANAIASVYGTRYTYGTSANHLYPAAGGSDDWAMGVADAKLSYTIELPGGNYGFKLPSSRIKPVGTETFAAMKVFHDYVVSTYAN